MDPGDLRSAIAENIRELADRRGLSLNQLVDLAGVGRSSFYRALNGESALTTDSLAKLADVLDVHPAALMLDAGQSVARERAGVRVAANPTRKKSRKRGGRGK